MVLVVSGPSGAGKDTVLNRMKERNVPADFIITLTTRPPRDYEIDGVNYYFVAEPVFMKMIENGELLEHARVYGNWYGVPKKQVAQSIQRGRDAIIKVDIQGAATIKKSMPEACFVFVTPPDASALSYRLRKRNTESVSDLELRLKTAGAEFSQLHLFDYVVLNCDGEVDAAVDDVISIIRSEKLKLRSERQA
ncbi:MAG: guanylate kinase [Dehalococcoidales bacterium]